MSRLAVLSFAPSKLPENPYTTVFNNFYDTSDIAVINAGYQKKVDHSFGPYTNNYHVLQYILDGQGTLRIGSNEWHLTKNTLFYLPANTACKYYVQPPHAAQGH